MAAPLVDGFGRVVRDLRVSVTDRCNFRCFYCMPEEGIPCLPRQAILSFEEIKRLVRIFLGLGVHTVRLTGGEPLLRRGIEDLVSKLAALGIPDLALSTNGFLLTDKAEALAAAGLRRVNVSVDSLHRDRFARITRSDALDRVLEGLRAAERAGLEPVKVNCVMVRDSNADEVLAFARLARETGYEVRFIEFMPLDGDGAWTEDRVVPSSEVLALINNVFGLEPIADSDGPATLYRFTDGAPGTIGVVTSVTLPFCQRCDRVRLTADGKLRTCLFALEETDLVPAVRNGLDDEAIAIRIRQAVSTKWAGHRIGRPDFVRPDRPMSMIGG